MPQPRFYIGLILYLALIVGLGFSLWKKWQREALIFGDKTPTHLADDRIFWENTDRGVEAKYLHPLLNSYNETQISPIKQGDRLIRLDYKPVYRKEWVDAVAKSGFPNKMLIATVVHPQTVDTANIFLRLSYPLHFLPSENPSIWRVNVWFAGIAFVLMILVVLILFPLVKRGVGAENSLLGIVIVGLFSVGWLFLHNSYHILTLEWENEGGERLFFYVTLALNAVFSILFLQHFAKYASYLSWIFFGTLAVYLLGSQGILYQEWVEAGAIGLYATHITAAVSVYLLQKNAEPRSIRNLVAWSFLGIFALFVWGKTIFALLNPQSATFPDDVLTFCWELLLLLPALIVAFDRLRFGRVSLVLTQTIEYAAFFLMSLLGYLALQQLLELILPNNDYQNILAFIFTLLFALLLRNAYQARLQLFRKYFISTQQNSIDKIRVFQAQIPQYSDAQKLLEDTLHKMQDYVETGVADLWWEGEISASLNQQSRSLSLALSDSQSVAETTNQDFSELYSLLSEQQAIWCRTAALSSAKLTEKISQELADSPYSLALAIQGNEHNKGLFLLGAKKKGFYNLTDVEILSQVVQQAHLTLNVLQLVGREKDLLRQTYQANLTALRAQINPHFLFNTLNTISALIHDSPELAEKATEKLAFIFRYTLDTSGLDFVPLEKEMKLISTYLEIEQIRFGKRLETEIDIEEGCEEVEIPAFILQTVVENCIKHGIAKITGQGFVSIAAYTEENTLKVEVYDNGPGIQTERVRKSTGLSNSIARLENIYDLTDLLQFENTGNGTLVTLCIPLFHEKTTHSNS